MTALTATYNVSALIAGWVRTNVAPLTAALRVMEKRRTVDISDAAVRADVRASQQGDGEAYARIVRRYQDLLARRMTRFTRDPAKIEELVHDVFVEAYYGLGKFRGDAPLEHWLQKIATRVGYRYWKERARARVVSYDEQTHDRVAEDESAAAGESMEHVAAMLERLPPRDRLVLTLLYVEDRSVAEAADLAGWSHTMVKVQAYRARGKLRKLIEQSSSSEMNG